LLADESSTQMPSLLAALIQVHEMETSFSCPQLCTPQPRCGQLASVSSFPTHSTSSIHRYPVPAPYWLPSVRPTYLATVIIHLMYEKECLDYSDLFNMHFYTDNAVIYGHLYYKVVLSCQLFAVILPNTNIAS